MTNLRELTHFVADGVRYSALIIGKKPTVISMAKYGMLIVVFDKTLRHDTYENSHFKETKWL